MRNPQFILFFLSFFFFNQIGTSQVLYDQKSLKNFDQYKEVVFVLPSEDTRINDIFESTVKQYFTLEIEYLFKNEKEAYKYWRKNKKTVLIAEIVQKLDTSRMLRETIFNLNGKKRILKLYLKDYSLGIDDMDFYYAIQYLQHLVKNSGNLKSSNTLKDLTKINGTRLKSKTLLVLESQIKDLDAFKSAYPFKYEIVNIDQFKKTILSQNKDFVYLYKANKAGDVSAVHYNEWRIIDAHDGGLISWCSSGVKQQLGAKEIKFMLKKAKK